MMQWSLTDAEIAEVRTRGVAVVGEDVPRMVAAVTTYPGDEPGHVLASIERGGHVAVLFRAIEGGYAVACDGETTAWEIDAHDDDDAVDAFLRGQS